MALGDRIALLREGELQQVGSPQGLYEYPANRYVASFFGSPPMNFLPVTVSERWARGPGLELELPRPPGVASAVLGIRPEALTIAAEASPGTLEMRVELVERLGATQLLHGRVGPHALVARAPTQVAVAVQDRVRLKVDGRRLHLFDAGSGRTLL
jgi:ABC-type sugar transport system ATPase subunit